MAATDGNFSACRRGCAGISGRDDGRAHAAGASACRLTPPPPPTTTTTTAPQGDDDDDHDTTFLSRARVRGAGGSWSCMANRWRCWRGRAPSHFCHAFCDVDDKTSMLKTKNVDFVLWFHRKDGTPLMGLLSECAPRPIPAMRFATWTTKRRC